MQREYEDNQGEKQSLQLAAIVIHACIPAGQSSSQSSCNTAMAGTVSSHSYIVLRDQPKEYPCGSLVELKEGEYCHHGHSWQNLARSLLTSTKQTPILQDSDLAPLTEQECLILDALPSCAARFAVYSTPGKLEWGVGLKVGDTVLARLPGGKEEYTTAIIRWIGNFCGLLVWH